MLYHFIKSWKELEEANSKLSAKDSLKCGLRSLKRVTKILYMKKEEEDYQILTTRPGESVVQEVENE